MILLDTNVLSELLRAVPNPAVVQWATSQPLDTLFTTTVTQAEMLYGVRLLPAGQRRQQLEEAVPALFTEDFVGRVLPFDSDAATAYARIAAERKRTGRPISQFMRRSRPLHNLGAASWQHATSRFRRLRRTSCQPVVATSNSPGQAQRIRARRAGARERLELSRLAALEPKSWDISF